MSNEYKKMESFQIVWIVSYGILGFLTLIAIFSLDHIRAEEAKEHDLLVERIDKYHSELIIPDSVKKLCDYDEETKSCTKD